jgi:hypothetical protein
VFAGFPLDVCVKGGTMPIEFAGDPGTATPAETNCCLGIPCECYIVTYVEPIGPVTGLTEFSYINCEGDPVESSVGDGITFFPTSRNVCAQEDTIILNGGDESATWEVTTGVDCCLSFFPSFISSIPDPTDGCDATLDTPCWVSNIGGTLGNEVITTGSTVYTDAAGTIPFIGDGINQYKITITGSSKCTSSEVAPDGDISGAIGICSTCP